MRRSELVTLLKGSVLNGGAPTTFVDELEGGGGQGWYRAWVRFEIDFTLGTGSGAKTDEPELSIIKSITLRSDKNEYFVNAQSGRAMYDWARRKMRRAPRKDAFAAATAKYYVCFPLLFADDDLARPEDTIIDTGRYESMTFQVVMGGVSDLLTTVGTSTVAFKVWLVAERTTARLIESQLPIRYISYDSSPAIDLTAQTVVKLDRGDGIRIKRLLIYSGSGGSVGSPFSGIPVNTIIETVEMEDTIAFPVREQVFDLLQDKNAAEYALETAPAGRGYLDFMLVDENGSLFSSYDTAKQSKVDLNFTIKAGAPANPIVSVGVEQVRELVGAAA